MSESKSNEFKARIGREVPKAGDTRVVFSIRTARGTRMEIDGTFTEDVVLAVWKSLNEDMGKRAAPAAATPRRNQLVGLKRCAAHRDGECSHAACPQIRDNEPAGSGRHCPLDTREDE